jgi:helicase
LPYRALVSEKFEELSTQPFGLPAVALPLATLSVRLTRGQCLALLNAGVRTEVELNALSDERLHDCVGVVMALQLRPEMAPKK